MSQRWLQSRHSQPFVRLSTIRDMTTVARKMAMIRAAVQEVVKIESQLLSSNPSRQVAIQGAEAIAKAAGSVGQWAGEAADILKAMRRDIEGYMRDLRNAPN